MQRIGRPRSLEGQTVADCLMKVPILRGWDGNPDDAKDWMTVGSGRKLEAAKSNENRIAATNVDVEEEWKNWSSILSKEFIHYVRSTRFCKYLCPQCNLHI